MKIDQRLFTFDAPTGPEPLPQPKSGPAPKSEPVEPVVKAPPAPSRGHTARQLKPESIVATRFDLDDEPLYKASYVFTQEELEALEDLTGPGKNAGVGELEGVGGC